MNAPDPFEQSDNLPADDVTLDDASSTVDDELLDAEAPDLPAPLATSPRRRFWSHAMLVLVVFISGSVVGSSLTLILDKAPPENRPMPGGPPTDLAKQIVLRWRDKLELTDEQADKIFQIVKERQEALNELRHEIEPQFAAELATMREQIDEVLDDDQQKKWHEIMKSIRERYQPPRSGDGPKHGFRGGPGGGHPGWSRGGQEAFFKSQDKDGDGNISREEASQRLNYMFDKVDENKDGKLDQEEIRRSFEQMKQRFGRQQGQQGRGNGSSGGFRPGGGGGNRPPAPTENGTDPQPPGEEAPPAPPSDEA